MRTRFEMFRAEKIGHEKVSIATGRSRQSIDRNDGIILTQQCKKVLPLQDFFCQNRDCDGSVFYNASQPSLNLP